ncbi:hypothetical protein ACJX0J_010770, partial [Zea mays]
MRNRLKQREVILEIGKQHEKKGVPYNAYRDRLHSLQVWLDGGLGQYSKTVTFRICLRLSAWPHLAHSSTQNSRGTIFFKEVLKGQQYLISI